MKNMLGLVAVIALFSLIQLGCGSNATNPPTPQTSIPAPIPDIDADQPTEPDQTIKPSIEKESTAKDSPESDGEDSNDQDIENAVAEAPAKVDNKVYEITFDDVKIGLQPDQRFREFMLTDRAKSLDGKIIKIAGNMLADVQQKKVEEFILLRNKTCKYGPGGQADHLMFVQMEKDKTTTFRNENTVYEVTGRLKIKATHGKDITFSIYELENAKVTIK